MLESESKESPVCAGIGDRRRNMELSLKNIGKIDTASVLIDGITIIAGENNTGKSTVGRALFSVFSCFNDIEEKVRLEREESVGKIVDIIKTQSEKSLADLHHRYLPAPTAVGIKDRGAANLARQIENHYRALKVYVRVIPTEVMADRYIFKLETLNETKDVDISRTAKTVQRRLKKYEWFRVDLRNPL